MNETTRNNLLQAQIFLAKAKHSGLSESDKKEVQYMLTIIPSIIARAGEEGE